MLSPYPGFGKPQQWDREQAARLRRFRGEPLPLSDEFQERYLATMAADDAFTYSTLKKIADFLRRHPAAAAELSAAFSRNGGAA